jgi:hypothetical protein
MMSLRASVPIPVSVVRIIELSVVSALNGFGVLMSEGIWIVNGTCGTQSSELVTRKARPGLEKRLPKSHAY